MPPRSWSCVQVLVRLLAAGTISLVFSLHVRAETEPSVAYTVTVSDRDTLIDLGRRYLADPRQWPQLQTFNRIPHPRRIPVGTVVRIPVRLLAAEAVPATLLAVSGDVRGADGQALVAGQSVPQGGRLHTGDGQASVRLVDGTVLRLRPSTAVQIDTSRRLPRVGAVLSGVQVQQGQVEVTAEPQAQKSRQGGLPGFRVNTPQGLLGVRGTEFRVSVDPQAELTRSEVLEGQVAASGHAGGPVQRIDAGFGVVVDRTGTVPPPVRLLPAPEVAGWPTRLEQVLVRLPLRVQPGAVAYVGQIATDARFEPVLQTVRVEARADTPVLRFADLPDGRYLLWVRAEDALGLQGPDAQHAFTLKARPEPPLTTTPANAAVQSAGRVEFGWTAAQDTHSYRWQLAATDDFRVPLLDRRGLEDSRLSVDGLAPGIYHWRMASERSGADQGPFGTVQKLELRALPAPLPAPVVGPGGIRLSWEGLPGQTFDVEFARDPGFAVLEWARRTEVAHLATTLPGTGRYFVRLRARDPDGYLGPYTAPQQFTIPNCLREGQGACLNSDAGPPVLIGP